MLETHAFGCGEKPVSLLVVGFATDQAKNIDVWERTISVPSTAVEAVIPLVRKWQKNGAALVRYLQPSKRTSRKHVEIPPLLSAIRPHIENQVSAKLGELAVGSDEAWEQAAGEYRPMMEIVAHSLSPGYTTAALSRRRQIAEVRPNMRPKTESPRKSGRTSEGEKK